MSDEKIVLVAHLKAKAESVDKIKEAALGIVEASRSEEGCLNYDIHQAIDDPAVFVWHETWANKAALDEHFAKPYFAEFFAVVQENTAEEPRILLTKMITEKA